MAVTRPEPPPPTRASTGEASRGVADAYDRTGRSWEAGPARLVYDRLAEVLVAASPVSLAGRRVLDVGAGTGAAARSIRAAGGHPVAVDVSLGMLRANATSAGRAVVADARRLPVPTGAVDGVVAAFSFNHLSDPAAGFREAARVCRPGSPILAAAYAADDHHPVRAAAEQALVEAGWVVDPWYADLRTRAVPLLATADGMLAAAHTAGLAGQVAEVTVDLPDLTPADLVAWRLGMAQSAPFLATLAPAARARVHTRARHLLGPTPPPLRRSTIVLTTLAT
jgi:demethylmenaquinone methyltransferase/2-methoxy-6-polyprenyl-1,4-benzoquinol methylase